LVYSNFRKGVMICRECGGECPLGTDDYDSVIHQGDCSRLRVIRMLRQFPIISDLEVQAHTCHVDGRIIDHGEHDLGRYDDIAALAYIRQATA